MCIRRFGGEFVPLAELASVECTVTPAVVVSTVPAAAAFALPAHMLARLNLQERVPVVMDVVYKPARTPLLQQVPIL